MVNLKEEGKKMDPLFPRLHISDAEKGGPRTPPRNKMGLSQTAQMSDFGSISMILPLPNNNGSNLGPATSSYHDSSYKRSVYSSFGRSCGSTRLATRLDSYHSSGINLNISLTTVKQTIETTNCQTLCNTRHMKYGDYNLYKPQEFSSTRSNNPEDEDDYLVPSLSLGNRGKIQTLSANSHIKHPTMCQKVLDPNDYKDINLENKVNMTAINDITKESQTRSILVDEPDILHDSSIRLPLKRKSCQENTTYKYGMKNAWTSLKDDDKIGIGTHEVLATNKNEDHVLETKFLSIYNITPKEVKQMIGPEQLCRARRIIIQQQKLFQSQVFELHRLIKVQKSLAKSPGLLLGDNFYKLKKPPSKDIFCQVDQHQNKETSLTFDNKSRKPSNIYNDTEKRYTTSLIDLPPPPLPPLSNLNGPKQPPWCYLPPSPQVNQWLVAVRSPLEGLIYKPYTRPSPPPFGLMTPTYGMSLTPSNGDLYNTNPYTIPTSYHQGIGVFPSTPLFNSYTLPTITKPSCSSTNDASYKENEIKSSRFSIPCNLLTQDINYKEDERKKDELPLFPITPMGHDLGQCREEKGFDDDDDDERNKVIKVVPHNPKLASESAARIFQFIQEERKHSDQ